MAEVLIDALHFQRTVISMIEIIIPAVLACFQAVLIAWFQYNQKTKDKITDLKIEKYRNEEKIEGRRRSDNSALVFGELWTVLHELNADRVYVVQPHPLGNESLLSIYFEVKRKGVEPMKPHVHNLPIADVAKFSSELTKNLFMYLTDIDSQVDDKYAKSILSSFGCQAAVVKRLSDNRHDWTGSIFCEFTRPMEITEEEARTVLHEAAMNIQYIMPAYQ